MSEHRWLDQVPAFVLDALDPADEAEFVSHLETCERCRTAVIEHREVVAGLSEFASATAPSRGLRDRVLEAAREEAAPRPDIAPARESSAGLGGRLPWLAAAALFAATLWGGFAASRAATERDALAGDLAEARLRIASLESEGAARDSMLAVLSGPAVETATLTATGAPPQIRLFSNAGQAVVLLTAFDLPRARAGRTYQLWGISGSADPVSIGVFDTDESGRRVTLLRLPGEGAFELGAVTDEPAGGSPQPTTQPFLVGTWAGAQ